MRKRGVTLLELMIVILIIGILVGLLVPATMKSRRAAQERRVAALLSALTTGIANFHAEYGYWPVSGSQPDKMTKYSSVEIIQQLRPNGSANKRHMPFWENEDDVKDLSGKTYNVSINPTGSLLSASSAISFSTQ